MAILILADHNYQHIDPNINSLVNAAKKIGDDIHVLVVSDHCEALAKEAAVVSGVSKVLVAEAPYYDVPSAENLAQLLADKAAGYSHVITTSTVQSKAVLPRAAGILGVAPVSDVMRIVDSKTFVRPIHAGSLLTTLQTNEKIVMLGIRPSSFDVEDPKTQSAASIEKVSVPADVEKSFIETRMLADPNQPQLTTARVVVGGGKGFQTAECFNELLTPLAATMNAAIGATREIVREGVSWERQVGQSGQTISPELYIAIGLSGASQHMCGIKGSKVVVAINRDGKAPICQYADYIMIGNLHRLVPMLTDALKKLPNIKK